MSCNRTIVGGIVKHKEGYGFKLIFADTYTANHYKDMFNFIINSDKIKTDVRKGYYDNLL